jgi:hypothetical protein
MTTSNDMSKPLAPPPAGTVTAAGSTGSSDSPDISSQIVAALERRPGDVVRCTKVGGNFYRCNWWAPNAVIGHGDLGASGGTFTTSRIRKSQFLEATVTAKGLVLRVHSDAGLGVRAPAATVAPRSAL